jgi:translation initiation factor IF-2
MHKFLNIFRYAVILAFEVKILPEAEKLAKKNGVKII